MDLSTLVPLMPHLSTLMLATVLMACGAFANTLIRVDKSFSPIRVDKSETPTYERKGTNPKTATLGTGRRDTHSLATRASTRAHWLYAVPAPMTRANLTKWLAPSRILRILTLFYYSPAQVPNPLGLEPRRNRPELVSGKFPATGRR